MLAVIILIVVPPEKLPEIMRNIGRLMNDFKRETRGIWSAMDATDKVADLKHQIKRSILEEPSAVKPATPTTDTAKAAPQASSANDVKFVINPETKKEDPS